MADPESRPVENPIADSGQPRLSFSFAKRHGVLIRGIQDGRLDTVCRHDVTPLTLAELGRHFQVPLNLTRVDSDNFNSLLQQTYEAGSNSAMQMVGEFDEDMDLSTVAEQLPEPSDLLESEDDAPIIRLINALLTEAIKVNASDIHIEPYENRLVVRLRVDGVLREVLRSRRAVAPLVVSRIKVMSRLDIAEKRLPQDGRISLRIAGRAVDVRVSTMPSGHGERVVLRLLDKQAGRLDLGSLGMETETRKTVDQLIHRPHGILLVTGPTGSGKTTTLYAALERINDNTRNIMTIEDPIEYYIDGIGQSQVNNKVKMTFARGLRAILRQDPDVVMVGEIRDLETAEIAVQASLTGHLVLSTLHTNTAVGAVTRLLEMGCEPYLVASALIGTMAQRLVRKICTNCKRSYQPNAAECKIMGIPPERMNVEISRGAGCSRCLRTGYYDRIGIYEFVPFDTGLANLVTEKATTEEMQEYAAAHGAITLRDDAMAS
ncbi:MAG: type II secretion system ATPase GspE [Proteobacteria bacterium]|nr:type II secretion system ATPase GspE [Pseudomonadota bacterium]